MSKLKNEDVLKLAQLVRLQLSEQEVTDLTKELSSILEYVEQLDAVDVSGLEPTNQVTGLTNVTRKDEIKDYGYSLEDLQANLPSSKGNQIKVKRMLG